MSSELGSLVISLEANTASMEEGFTRMEELSRNSSEVMIESFEKAQEKLMEFGAELASGLGAEAFIEMIKGSIEAADQLSKLSEKTGTSVEALAGLKIAAETNGLSFESVAQASKKLSTAIVANHDVFQQFGVTSKDSAGALVQLGDIFSAMPDGVEKSALAVKLFGKSGQDMIPFLNKGSEAIKDLIAKGEKLNPINAESARQSKEFNEQLATFEARSKAGATALIQNMVPALSDIIKAMSEAQKQYGTLFAMAVGAGVGIAKLFGADIDPQKRAENELNALLKEQLSIRRDISLLKGRAKNADSKEDRDTAASEEAAARAKLATINQQINQQIKVVNDPQIAAGSAFEAKRKADKARQAANEGKGHDLLGALTGGNAAALVTQISEYDKLIESIKKKSDATDLEIQQQHKLTTEQKFTLDVMAQIDMANKHAKLLADAKGTTPKEKADIQSQYGISTSQKATIVQNLTNESVKSDQAITGDELTKTQDQITAKQITYNEQLAFTSSLIGKNAEQVQILTAQQTIQKTQEQELAKAAQDWANITNQNDPIVIANHQKLLDLINNTAAANTQAVAKQITDNTALAKSWNTGATTAVNNYFLSVNNGAQQASSLIGSAFKGAEDTLTKFFETGKINMTSFIDMMIQQLARLAAQQTMAGLGSIFGQTGSQGGSLISSAASFFGLGSTATPASSVSTPASQYSLSSSASSIGLSGGRATGGNAMPGNLYQVNENGPEMLSYGGADYLMMGGGGGTITPVSSVGASAMSASPSGGTTMQVNVINNASQQVTSTPQQNSSGGIDIIVQQIETSIAGNVTRGTGPLNTAMTNTFGLNRAAGAY